MDGKIKKVKDSDFDSVVLFPRRPAVVFFSAEWSAASAASEPIFAAAAEKYCSKAAVYEMNVDENRIIPVAYGVRRVPAVLTFADGRLAEAHAGFITPEKLAEKIERITSSGKILDQVAAFSRRIAARIGGRVGFLLSELF